MKLHCYYYTRKYDDSITRYFPFLKENSPKNRMLCNAWEMFRKVFLIILSLFANLKLMLFIHEKFLVYKLEIFKNFKEVKHMIMIIAIIFIFFILCDIWSTVENYFQNILRTPWKNPLPPSYSLPPKNLKIASPPLFANIENFLGSPCR